MAAQPVHDQERIAAEVVAFLSDPACYPGVARVELVETHMSRVFIAGSLVYKMKKALRFDFVDFTLLTERRLDCEREVAVNQELAPGLYLGVTPVTRTAVGKLRLGGDGEPLEWLVVMRRFTEERLLSRLVLSDKVRPREVDQLSDLLARFYLGARRVTLSQRDLVELWEQRISLLRKSLTDPLFRLDAKEVEALLTSLERFLRVHSRLLLERMEQGWLLDGHGDLKPEHVHMGPPILLIDRLEFDERLRWVDPFDEAVFLGMECERLGAPWLGQRLGERLSRLLRGAPAEPLLHFYRCYRACLRARLSIEHLRDAKPRTPERWLPQTRDYLQLAWPVIMADPVQS